MRTIQMGRFQVSVMAAGCMRMGALTPEQADHVVETALEQGINLFDHADIYGGGNAERIFGKVLRSKPALRQKMVLQSKCGIRNGTYDFSYAHLTGSVDGILSRLQTDHLDTLLLHRPDVLAEAEEVARAMEDLKQQGKVLQFGVSNMNPAQILLLESWTGETMVADQLQLSLVHAGLVTSEINVNMQNQEGAMFDGSVLSFCQRRGTVVQAWSPLQDRRIRACFIDHENYPALNEKLKELAEVHAVTPAAIALAWILRIPGKVQTIVGATNPRHLQEACQAEAVALTRQEWYSLYRACGYAMP